MIRCSGITVTYGSRNVVDHVDLSVARGEWLSVVGANGAGKSTLLRVLGGLQRSEGTVELDGEAVAQMSRRLRAQLLAVVPQAPLVPDGIRVVDYVLLGRTPFIRGLAVEGPADLAAVGDALEQLELTELAERVVATLSGGERQRVFLARALAQGSPIVLLDEPTTALDVGHQQQVLELIDRLRHERKLTVVTTMHDLTLAGQYAERLVLLDAGRVAVEGTAAEVLTEANLERFYGARVRIIDDHGRLAVVPLRDAPPVRGEQP